MSSKAEAIPGLGSKGRSAGVALVIGGVLAGLAFPKLLKSGRRAAKSLGGMKFRSGPPGAGRATADPANGRPA